MCVMCVTKPPQKTVKFHIGQQYKILATQKYKMPQIDGNRIWFWKSTN